MVQTDPSIGAVRLWALDSLGTDSATQWRFLIYGIDPIWNTNISSNPYRYNVEVYGTLLTYNNTDVDSSNRVSTNGLKITDYFNKSESYEIGGSTSSEIELDFVNDDGYMNSFPWNWMYFMYADFWDEPNNIWVSVPLGVYQFEKPTKLDGVLVHVKGHDNMQRIESCSAAGLFDNLTFTDDPSTTATLTDIYNALVSRTNSRLESQYVNYSGIFSGMDAMWYPTNMNGVHTPNSDYPFFSAPFDPSQYNCRQVLEFIAGMIGTNAYVSRDGYVKLRKFEDAYYKIEGVTHYYTIDTTSGPTDVISVSKCEYQTPPIDKLEINIVGGSTVSYGTGSNKMVLSGNPLFKSYDSATVAQNIYDEVTELQAYTPMSLKTLICPTIEAGDVIRLVYDGATYLVPIFQQTISWYKGPFVSEIVSSGLEFRQNEESQADQITDISSRLESVESDLSNVESDYVPKDGGTFTGDVEFDGTVDIVNRRANAYLSSAGWYNIIKFNIGSSTSVKFATAMLVNIRLGTTYNNTSNCVHECTMVATYGTNPSFMYEKSRANANIIDKIRYRYDSNNIGWIDIHYTESSSNDVWMTFDVGSYNTTQKYWLSQNFVAVADAPSTGGTADTILTTHDFLTTSGGSISFTPTTGSAYSSYGNCWYAKDGNIVEVHVGISGLTANTSTTIGTLPEGFRPKVLTVATGNGSSISTLARARISTAGVITVYSASTSALIDVVYICAL